MCKSKKLPTDLEVLQCIYEMYESEYLNQSETNVYVPIDIYKVADRLKAHPGLIFGRLYYHLNRKYNYKVGSAPSVEFFMLEISGEKFSTPQRHVIQFPLLTSILAELKNEYFKFSLPVLISSVLSIVAIVISIVIPIFFKD